METAEGDQPFVNVSRENKLASSEERNERVSQDLASSLSDRITLTRSQSSDRLHKLTRFVGVCSIQGRRQEMEDAHKIVPPPSPSVQPSPATEISFFGVFDGHGGRRAADFAEVKLYELLLEHPELSTKLSQALAASFEETERLFLEQAVEEDMMDGTTAAVAVLSQGQLVVGNVGDSELVLCRVDQAVPLCQVHNMNKNTLEIERVKAEGGVVYKNRIGHPKFNPQVISLGVSRAIGDLPFKHEKFTDGKPSGLSAVPDIAVVPLTEEHRFLIIGCDGLWDVVEHQAAVDAVLAAFAEGHTPGQSSQLLVKMASDAGSTDNITVMVIRLEDFIKK